MQIPEYLVTGLTNFFTQLTQLMSKAGCPLPVQNNKLITTFHRNSDFASLQRSYSFIWVILEKILPVLRDDKKDLWDKGTAIKDMANEFKLDNHLAAIDISGKWSYYAASEFAATMEELAKEFNVDESTKNIKLLFGFFGFNPDKLVSDIANKLREKKRVQEEYENLQLIFLPLKSFLDNLKPTSCFTITPENVESDLITTKRSEASINQLEIQQKALEQLEAERRQLEKTIKELEPSISVLPKKMLLINEENEHVFEDTPDVAATLKSSTSLQKDIADKLASTTKMLSVLKNKAYFQQVYDDIVTKTISPLEEKLSSLKDLQTYSFEIHSGFSFAHSALGEANFSARIQQQGIPHPEYAKESEIIQKSFNNLFDKRKKELTEKIIAKQKQCFNDALTQGVKKKFDATCKEKSDEIALKTETIGQCEGNAEKLSEFQTSYNGYTDWLREQSNPKKLVEEWVTENKFQKEDIDIQRLLNEFYSEKAAYEDFRSSIEGLAKSVEDVIEAGKIVLELANTAKIEQLKTEAEALAEEIVKYKTVFNKASQAAKELEGSHQINYQREKEKFDKINNRINRRLRRREKLSIALGIQQIPPNIPVLQLQTILSDSTIYQPIENSLKTLTASKEQLSQSITLVNNRYKTKKQDYKNLLSLKTQIIKAFKKERQDYESLTLNSQITEGFKKDQFSELITLLSNIPNDLFEQSDREKVVELLQNRVNAWTLWSADQDEKDCLNYLEPYIEKQKNEIQQLIDQKKKHKEDRAATTSDIKKINENYITLKKVDDELLNILPNAQFAEKALQDLRAVQEKEIQETYAELSIYLPEKTIPAGQEYETHRKNIATMTCDLNLRNAKLEIFKLKQALSEQQAILNNAHSNLATLEVKSAAFEYKANPLDSLARQWEIHAQQVDKAISTSKEKVDTDAIKLTNAGKSIVILTKQLNSIHELLSRTREALPVGLPEPSDLSALCNTKDATEKELANLKQKINKMENLRQKKIIALQVQKNICDRKNKQAKTYQSILEKAEQCEKNIEGETRKLNSPEHQYPNTLVDDIIQGRKKVNFIPDEDNFYVVVCEKNHSDLQTEITALENQLIKSEKISDLDKAFNQKLTEKINACKASLSILQDTKKERQAAWQTFSDDNLLIGNSRQVIADGKAIASFLANLDYRNFDLRRIQLENRNFANIPLQKANFEHATLRNCTFGGSLEGVNFGDADVVSCNFNKANFKGVRLNAGTRIHWQYGYDILSDNLANPHLNTDQTGYLTELVTSIRQQKAGGISGKWVLGILKEIAAANRPDNINEKDHLRAQQERAVFFMQQIVPHLSIDAVLELHDLVAKKHDDDKNPYGFIRHELDWAGWFPGFRMKYGNTKPWETIITLMKEKLMQHKSKLPEEKCNLAVDIMRTQTVHTGGFGKIYSFFSSVKPPKEWEGPKVKHDKNKSTRNNS